jgi:hypothetical protein
MINRAHVAEMEIETEGPRRESSPEKALNRVVLQLVEETEVPIEILDREVALFEMELPESLSREREVFEIGRDDPIRKTLEGSRMRKTSRISGLLRVVRVVREEKQTLERVRR